jgi:NAD(P)-dependent dehydrogenase (short-subunit alcohol dehydrogenase family)
MDHSFATPRHVLITGASTGIGKACALHLAARGFRVWAGVRAAEAGRQLEAEASAGGSLTSLVLDVTRPDTIAAAASQISSEAGSAGLQGLVNNAGIGVGGPVEFVSIDDWRRQFEVNLFGQIAVIQAFLPLLRKHVAATASGAARIVNISSIAGRVGQPMLGPYCGSKHALEAVSDALRMEVRAQGIRVHLVEPGAVQSEIWRKGTETLNGVDRSHPLFEIYGPTFGSIERILRVAAEKAIPAVHVARIVEHCLTARRPRARYLVGLDAKLGVMLKGLVPTALLDRVFAGAFGIKAK